MNELENDVEITEEMKDAGAGAFYAGDLRFENAPDIAVAIYRAMVRAKNTTKKCLEPY